MRSEKQMLSSSCRTQLHPSTVAVNEPSSKIDKQSYELRWAGVLCTFSQVLANLAKIISWIIQPKFKTKEMIVGLLSLQFDR